MLLVKPDPHNKRSNEIAIKLGINPEKGWDVEECLLVAAELTDDELRHFWLYIKQTGPGYEYIPEWEQAIEATYMERLLLK